jgi:hypothetical protein
VPEGLVWLQGPHRRESSLRRRWGGRGDKPSPLGVGTPKARDDGGRQCASAWGRRTAPVRQLPTSFRYPRDPLPPAVLGVPGPGSWSFMNWVALRTPASTSGGTSADTGADRSSGREFLEFLWRRDIMGS